MTPREYAKQNRHIGEAWEEGKDIQFRRPEDGINEWVTWLFDFRPPFEKSNTEWRIKPEPPQPKYRAWKPEEVPAGCWLRRISEPGMFWTPLTVSSHGVVVATAFPGKGIELANRDFNDLLRRGEHSIDGGKTWRPCGVEVKE